jgi:hypothetical protein
MVLDYDRLVELATANAKSMCNKSLTLVSHEVLFVFHARLNTVEYITEG